jgi:hypothetical protein
MANPSAELKNYHRGIRLSLSVLLRAVDQLDLDPPKALDLARAFTNAVIGQSPGTNPFLDAAMAKALDKLGFLLTPEQSAAIFPASVKNASVKEETPIQEPKHSSLSKSALDRIKQRLRKTGQPKADQTTEPAAI